MNMPARNIPTYGNTLPNMLNQGSGGIITLQTQQRSHHSTGMPIFIVFTENSNQLDGDFVASLKNFTLRYGLNKNQLSMLFNVTRPTIYSWFKTQTNEGIRQDNKAKFYTVKDALSKLINPELAQHFGKLLSSRSDRTAHRFWEYIHSFDGSGEVSTELAREIEFKLYGIKKFSKLASKLANKKPLISI